MDDQLVLGARAAIVRYPPFEFDLLHIGTGNGEVVHLFHQDVFGSHLPVTLLIPGHSLRLCHVAADKPFALLLGGIARLIQQLLHPLIGHAGENDALIGQDQSAGLLLETQEARCTTEPPNYREDLFTMG
ncbi:MAG: hypothetical protein BWY79_01833 [Actinobacteria bacterium ADurb.Bin444]|nr:MAG: hypothetical protein BWY79_01833 [Actinobacteria bacterium ADurb.Bin444]